MSDDKRQCLACVHCDISFEGDWSDVTPGAGMEVACLRGHWDFGEEATNKKLYMVNGNAATCSDYKQEEWA